MRIPLGNFGNVVAEPQRQAQIPAGAGTEVGAALARLGQVGMQVAADKMEEQRALEDDLYKTRSLIAYQEYDLETKTAIERSKQRLHAGEIDRLAFVAEVNDARQKSFTKTIGSLPSNRYSENVSRLSLGLNKTFALQAAGIVEQDQQREFGANAAALLDNAGKAAGMPGADIDLLNEQAGNAYLQLAARAGTPKDKAETTVQDWRDRNWTNQATQRAMDARDDIERLQQLERDLTAEDGFYAMRLDTDRRNAILRSVVNDRLRLENRLQLDVDRREAKAEKAIAEMDRHVASGIPIPVDLRLAWGERVKGTAFEGEFRQRLQDEEQVQQVLRMPIEQQIGFVQKKETDLMTKGGTPQDKTNITRLRSAVDNNLKQLQEAPLVFAQNRAGYTVRPLDLSVLISADGASKIGSELEERVATIASFQKQYGPQVKMHPLLPQEADMLINVLNQITPKDQSTIFGTLRASFNDDKGYLAVMQQIAPDSPVKALAGAIYAKRRGITLEKNWFGSDSVAAATNVAETLLIGESIVNKTKAQKAEDGVGKSMYLPPRGAFQTSFASVAGDLYRNGRSKAQETDLEAAYAYYVGRAAQTGRLTSTPSDIDSALVKESLAATVGEPINFHSRGMITAPWGMDSERFENNIAYAFQKAVKDAGLPGAIAYQFENYGLIHYRGGTYVPTMGGMPVLDPKTGAPLVLDAGDTLVDPGMQVPR